MNSAFLLVIWSVVGYAGTQFSTHTKMDWRPIGQFEAPNTGEALARCESAAKNMSIEPDKFRCLRSK